MTRSLTDQQRMDKFVVQTPTCWLWVGALDSAGYGRFTASSRNQAAHRWCYEWQVGPIPPGMDLDHLCRVRNCVRPSHLEPVTRRLNLSRGLRGDLYVPPDICGNGHDLTLPGAVVWRRDSGTKRRRCAECERERGRRYRQLLLERPRALPVGPEAPDGAD